MIINSTTELNKLKFTTNGSDRRNSAWSGQPFIPKDIPNVEYDNPNQTFQSMEGLPPEPAALGGIDFFLRGGILAATNAEDDVSRLTKLLFDTKSPNGFEFIAKQNVLSRQSVKTEATFGAGYGFGLINQGLYLPTSTLLQTGLAPIAPGSINLFGVNPITDNVPLNIKDGDPRKTGSGGINSYFGTINAQNIGSGGEQANRLVLLQDAVNTGKEQKTAGGKIRLGGRKNAYITRYGGGPNSIGGTVGRTTIPFTDQRTGPNNPKVKLNGFYDNKANPLIFTNAAQQTFINQSPTLNVNSIKYDGFLEAPLIGDSTNVIDYKPSEGNYQAFIRPPEVGGYESEEVSFNRGASQMYEAFIPDNSSPGRFAKNTQLKNNIRLGQNNLVYDNDADKANKFANPLGPDKYYELNSASPTISEGVFADEIDVDIVAKSNLFISGSGVTNTFAGLYPDLSGSLAEDYYSLSLNKDRYDQQAPGGLRLYSNKIYSNPFSFIANEPGMQTNPLLALNNLTQTSTQNQLYSFELNSQGNSIGLSNPLDFRKNTIARNFNSSAIAAAATPGSVAVPGIANEQMENQLKSSKVLSLAPDYRLKNQNKRINMGDPGQEAGITLPNTSGQTVTPVKNVLNYGVDAFSLQALDKLTATPMYKGTQVDQTKATKDSVDFNIAIMDFNKPSQNTYIHFRAFINEFNDNYTANWEGVKYVGRGEELYNYQGFGREISMGWTVYAQSKAELIPMYKKLNYLASSLAPDYSSSGYMRGNIARITMGGYLYDQPGIIKSISYGIPEESPWEIAIGVNGEEDKSVKQMPHMIQVTGFTFIPIQKFVPARADSLTDPRQKYIALANSAGSTNYSDTYKSYENTGTPTI